MYTFYKLNLRLITEQLGTCTEASIFAKHVQQKAKKEIALANNLAKKVAKSLQKYVGTEFPESKEVAELQGILRTYMGYTGLKHILPDNVEDLLIKAEEIKEEWEEMMAKGDEGVGTVFMRDEKGYPIISSHMILGNLKENLRISVNNGDKEIAKSKVSVGEMGALDIKVVEHFLRPSKDVEKDENGKPAILERPIRFERMGKTETAICRSEALPAGTEYECTLRVRTKSPLADKTVLTNLLTLGRNNGLGQWRGSGNKGSYVFKLSDPLINYKDPSVPEGWN